jgi:hypothetical protein
MFRATKFSALTPDNTRTMTTTSNDPNMFKAATAENMLLLGNLLVAQTEQGAFVGQTEITSDEREWLKKRLNTGEAMVLTAHAKDPSLGSAAAAYCHIHTNPEKVLDEKGERVLVKGTFMDGYSDTVGKFAIIYATGEHPDCKGLREKLICDAVTRLKREKFTLAVVDITAQPGPDGTMIPNPTEAAPYIAAGFKPSDMMISWEVDGRKLSAFHFCHHLEDAPKPA